MTTHEALLRLLTENPNVLVTRTQVFAELGREVSRNAVSKAARRLRRSMAIDGYVGAGGGYRYLVPVSYDGDGRSCATCAQHGRYGMCQRLQRRTSDNQVCGGWRQ